MFITKIKPSLVFFGNHFMIFLINDFIWAISVFSGLHLLARIAGAMPRWNLTRFDQRM